MTSEWSIVLRGTFKGRRLHCLHDKTFNTGRKRIRGSDPSTYTFLRGSDVLLCSLRREGGRVSLLGFDRYRVRAGDHRRGTKPFDLPLTSYYKDISSDLT